MTAEYANPFKTWAELTRRLRDRFLEELEPGAAVNSPYTGEMLGSLAALVTRCEHMGDRLRQLEQKDPVAYAAFLRALGRDEPTT